MKAESPELKPRAPRAKLVLITIAVSMVSIVVMAAIGTGAFAASLVSTMDSASRLSKVFPEDSLRPAPAPDAEEKRSAQNILVIGTDAQGATVGKISPNAQQVTDTVMIVHIAKDRRSVQVVPLRRDMIFPIPGIGDGKLGVALRKGGVKLVVQTIESLIDVRLDHVVLLKLTTAKDLTDAVGGIAVSNPEAFDAVAPKGMAFDEGMITLDGDEALAYIREFKAFDKDRNSARLENQKRYIGAVLERCFADSLLWNPVALSDSIHALVKGATVDGGFNAAYILGLGYELRNIDVTDISFIDFPTTDPRQIGDGWSVLPKLKKLPKIQSAFRDDTLVSYSP